MPKLFPTTLVGSYPQPDWLIDRARLSKMVPRVIGKCPTCGKPLAATDENPAAPFCSPRCRLIDLGNWLGGAYRVPGPDLPTDDGEGDDDGHARRP